MLTENLVNLLASAVLLAFSCLGGMFKALTANRHYRDLATQ